MDICLCSKCVSKQSKNNLLCIIPLFNACGVFIYFIGILQIYIFFLNSFVHGNFEFVVVGQLTQHK